jgi:hypothetical protein
MFQSGTPCNPIRSGSWTTLLVRLTSVIGTCRGMIIMLSAICVDGSRIFWFPGQWCYLSVEKRSESGTSSTLRYLSALYFRLFFDIPFFDDFDYDKLLPSFRRVVRFVYLGRRMAINWHPQTLRVLLRDCDEVMLGLNFLSPLPASDVERIPCQTGSGTRSIRT